MLAPRENTYNEGAQPFTEACIAEDETPHGDPPSEQDRIAAHVMINDLGNAMGGRRVSLTSNYVENIRRYTTETAADGALAFSRSGFVALATKAAYKTGFTTLPKLGAERVIEPVLERLTGSGLSVLGKTLNGFVVGLLYDVLVDLLFDPTGKALRAAYRKGVGAGANIVAGAAQGALAELSRAAAEDQLLLDELTRAIEGMQSRRALHGLSEWMRLQMATLRIPVADYSLYEGMLATWLLQRAGDEEDANKHTDPEAYEAAHDKLAPDGNLARRDLFIHQCRFAFGRFGIDADATLAQWQNKLDAQPAGLPADELIASLGPLRMEASRIAQPDRFVRTLISDRVVDVMGAFVLTDDVEATRRLAKEAKGVPGLAGGLGSAVFEEEADYTEKFIACAKSGGVGFRCTVELTDADGAVYVDKYRYRLWGAKHDADGEPTDRSNPRVPTREWTESPD